MDKGRVKTSHALIGRGFANILARYRQIHILISCLTSLISTQLAFEPVFLAQASPALLYTYAPLAAKLGIFGCYLQTELGHGSNVSALETTATYIPETQEFEIHSPTLTSSKWWIGALGKTATHGVVQAKLLLPDGKHGMKDMGPHLFFVQLRSLGEYLVRRWNSGLYIVQKLTNSCLE